MNKRFNHRAGIVAIVLLAAGILSGCGKSPQERAANHFNRGKEFASKGDDVRARIEFRNAVQFHPNMVEAWRALADIEGRAKNWAAVLSASNRVADLDSKDVDSRLRIAKLSFVTQKLDDALKTVNTVLEIDSENIQALALRGAISLRLGDGRAAIQDANKLLGIDPANTEAIVILATEKLIRGDGRGALAELNELSTAGGNDIGVIILKIRIFEAQKNYDQIEAQLKKLIELNPNERAFKAELVRFYVSRNRGQDAEQLVRAISEANPTDLAAGLDVVRYISYFKGLDAGAQELSRRIAAHPDMPGYSIAMAEFEFGQRRYDQAKAILNKMISESKAADADTARLKLADMALTRREYAEAQKVVEQVLASDARNVGALRIRASARLETGQLEDAILDIRSALNDQPRSPDLLSLLGVAYERGGQIELAEKQFADAVRFSDYSVRHGLNYVAFLGRRGLTAQTENVMEELVARHPNDVGVLTNLAQLKLQKQDWQAAQQIADKIKSLGQFTGTAGEIEAVALAGQKKFDEGIKVLQQVQTANPGAARPMYSIVQTYLNAKQPEKAEDFLQSVLKTNPSNADAYVLLGLTKVARNNPDGAIKEFQAAVNVQSNASGPYKALADEYIRQRKLDEAEKILEQGLSKIPNDFNLRQAKAVVFERKGNFDQAIALYDELLKEQPGSMVLANNFASLISDHRTDKESLDRAHTAALALNRSDIPHFKDTLGWLYYLRGDYQKALPLLREAAERLPNLAVVNFHLGMVYKAVGDKEKALEFLKKAVELEPKSTSLSQKISSAIKELTS